MAQGHTDWFDVLRRLEGGEAPALAQLGRLVVGHLVRMRAYDLRDSWDDLSQEVVMKLWRAWRDGRIESEKAFVRFAGTVTRNTLVDWVDRARRAGRLGTQEEVERWERELSESDPVDPEEMLSLKQAIETLPEKERAVVSEIYLRGRGYEETAQVLDIPRGTVNRLQRQALQRLRALMKRSPEGPAAAADIKPRRAES